MSILLAADDVRRAITRIAHEIVERERDLSQLAIVGIRTRGDVLAARLRTALSEIEGRAQLFFRGDYATPYAEEKSVAFSLEVGEATYSLELAGVPGWEGFITGLRLDPLEGGDGREVCIREIRLTP